MTGPFNLIIRGKYFINTGYGFFLVQILKITPLIVRLPWGGFWICRNNVMGKNILLKNTFLEGEWKFVSQYLKEKMTFFDVGANEGFYTLLASKKIGKMGQIISFEPSERELNRLKLHLKFNRCENVTVEPVALSDMQQSSELFVCMGQETGCNSLRPPDVSDDINKVKVCISTLDIYAYQHNLENMDFIKVDIEGAELNFLKGATKCIDRFRPIILCEISDIRTSPWGYKAQEIFDFLERMGYIFHNISQNGKLSKYIRESKYNENYVAIPQEKIWDMTQYLI